MTPYLTFIISTIIIVAAAIKLAEYSDVISVRTGLGGLIVGTILLAGATSMPEVVTTISSFRLGLPDLAAGNLFGSNMVNMFLLAVVDLFNTQTPLLRRVALNQTLTVALGAAMMVVATIFILADEVDFVIGWVSVESLLLIVLYFAGVWLVQQEGKLASGPYAPPAMEPAPGFPSLRRGLLGFVIATAVIVVAVPQLVTASTQIADATGLGASFIGTVLLSFVTSLPEFLTSLAAVRMGAPELAVGNLFGSNVFNMLMVGVADFFYLEGSFLADINNDFALVSLLGILLMLMALIGNLARIERRILFVELDAIAIIAVYILGVYLLFLTGTRF